ncbi:potassium channel family protein [Planctomycetota bacterium]
MYIVIAGGGVVGGNLAQNLIASRHDVVVVDPDPSVCNKLYTDMGIVAIHGSAARLDVLKEAGIEKADIVVAATPHDAENLGCAILAKSLNVPLIIARMRDANYENAYKVAGVHRIVRVSDLMVNQIIMDIDNPLVQRVATIGGGKANIIMVTIPNQAKVDGLSVKEITQESQFPAQCVFAGIYHASDSQFTIPRGNNVVEAGDELYLVAPSHEIRTVVDVLTASAANGAKLAKAGV